MLAIQLGFNYGFEKDAGIRFKAPAGFTGTVKQVGGKVQITGATPEQRQQILSSQQVRPAGQPAPAPVSGAQQVNVTGAQPMAFGVNKGQVTAARGTADVQVMPSFGPATTATKSPSAQGQSSPSMQAAPNKNLGMTQGYMGAGKRLPENQVASHSIDLGAKLNNTNPPAGGATAAPAATQPPQQPPAAAQTNVKIPEHGAQMKQPINNTLQNTGAQQGLTKKDILNPRNMPGQAVFSGDSDKSLSWQVADYGRAHGAGNTPGRDTVKKYKPSAEYDPKRYKQFFAPAPAQAPRAVAPEPPKEPSPWGSMLTEISE